MHTLNKVLIVSIVMVLIAGPAYPQNRELIQLQRDVLDLKNIVNQLQTSSDQKNTAILSLVEKIADQVNGLAGNVQKMADSVNSHTDKSAAEMQGVISTMNNRVNELADNVAAIRSQLGGVSQQITTMKTEPLPGPDDSWRAASLDMTVGNYDLALQELQDFQAKYPNDPRSAKAQLFKGDALFAQKKYEQAVIEYDTFLQKYPENDDTKTALYKKGLAQAESDPKAAAATLQQVVNKYKGTVEATNAQNKLRDLGVGARGKRGPGRHN